ncbi:MAG: hypothetical protein M3O46_21830, partial [Myxococcota bacterium]|nr:hypothetical protein [Myxococcota bacterium]
ARGEDPRSPLVRAHIFRAARAAHAGVQGGGSGVDVAASVHGGVLRYTSTPDGDATVRALDLPNGVYMAAYDSGTSARTSDMRARWNSLRASSVASRLFATLCHVAVKASAAVENGDATDFVGWASEFGNALAALGQAAGSPIVPPVFAELAALAEREHAAFLPSGAGGGDVAIWLGTAAPTSTFAARARLLSMRHLALRIDRGGLRPESSS